MDGYGTERLAPKDAESAVVARICEGFNLTLVLAKAHYDHMAGYFAEYGQVPTQSGELCYLAVASSEPAGKPLVRCAKHLVRLELTAAEDRAALRDHGMAALRQRHLARLARQARAADRRGSGLSDLLVDRHRQARPGRAARGRGAGAHPRQIRDIGPATSHKARVVQLYLWGLQFTEIELRTGHAEASIRRYLTDFRQIAALHLRGAYIAEIRAATGRSGPLIAEYIALYERACREFPAAPRLRDLLSPRRAQKGGPA